VTADPEKEPTMKDLIKEFKDFVNRGNLVELAIAFILATAFAPVVLSVVENIFMPIIAAIFGQPDFNELAIDIGEAEINYGIPLTLFVNFLLIALVCFLIVKAYNRMKKPVEAETGPTEVELLTEIRDALQSR
jgi:large conductance mechanosensitive channel